MVPNAELQARPEAEAQRKLEGVACKLWLGSERAALRGLQQFLDPCPRNRYCVVCLQAAGDTYRVFSHSTELRGGACQALIESHPR